MFPAGDPDVAKAYERITTVSAGTTQIVFENIRKFANMTCMPHRGWLHNSLDINLTGLESFNVKFLVMCQMPVVITIELCDPRDQVNSILMDNSMLDLHYPLISSADLWRPIILDTDHSELWDDSVEDVSPDYENFMIDLEKNKHLQPSQGLVHFITGKGPYPASLRKLGLIELGNCEYGEEGTFEHLVLEFLLTLEARRSYQREIQRRLVGKVPGGASTSPGNWIPVRLSVRRNTGDALVILRTVFQSYEQRSPPQVVHMGIPTSDGRLADSGSEISGTVEGPAREGTGGIIYLGRSNWN
uniref:(California timema) hypothetical protein n=1 Tax=Timema californicum TaxID=61474 RepID=A0A7R9IY22_TIMCA|nr:unnamed protein product [Timema californicum]